MTDLLTEARALADGGLKLPNTIGAIADMVAERNAMIRRLADALEAATAAKGPGDG